MPCRPITLPGSHSNTVFQGFGASDCRDQTDQERRATWTAWLKDLHAKRRRDKQRGRSIEGLEGQIEALREGLRRLKGE